MSSLILKPASASRPGGDWNADDFDVLADGVVVGRIMLAAAAPVGSPWLWTLAYGPHADARLRADARGGDGGVREELEARVKPGNGRLFFGRHWRDRSDYL